MLAIAWEVNGTSLEAALLKQDHEPLAYLVKMSVQMLLAMGAARIVNLTVSLAGSAVRWFRWRRRVGPGGRAWRFSTTEGAIVGLVVVGACLGWTPKDVYRHPEQHRWLELHHPSLLENPLGVPPGSRGTTKVVVSYWYGEGRRVVERSWEFTTATATDRVASRTILWSASDPERAVVTLNSGDCIFLPRSIGFENYCPPDNVVQAFLGGADLDEVLLMIIDARETEGARGGTAGQAPDWC